MKSNPVIFGFITMLLLLVVGCGGAEPTEALNPDVEPTQPPLPTESPPTETPAPTPTQEPSPTPDPVIFLDDFEGGLGDGWSVVNEIPERWSITGEGWLAIKADNPGMGASEDEYGMMNLFIRPVPKGDLVVTTRVISDPAENFKQATLYLLGEPVAYTAILTGFCSFCLPESGGYGVFMEAFQNGESQFEEPPFIERDPDNTDLYLRLIYSEAENSITGYYASEPDNWMKAFVVNDPPPFQYVGLGTGNLPGPDGSSYDLMAYYDYLEVAQIETPVRVNPNLPSEPVPPTETPRPEATPLPDGIVFRDDFDGYFQPGWEWHEEDPERWEFVEFGGKYWLQMTGGVGRTNYLLRPAPEEDFIITAHLIADPQENFQQANIGVYEDFNNYIVLNVGFCSMCVEGGEGFYMETFIDNNPFDFAYRIPRDPDLKDVYLRLVIEIDGSITGYYATPEDPENWIKLGAFGNYFEFKTVGIGVLNVFDGENTGTNIEAIYDYFEISMP